jgi:hypothetical protein
MCKIKSLKIHLENIYFEFGVYFSLLLKDVCLIIPKTPLRYLRVRALEGYKTTSVWTISSIFLSHACLKLKVCNMAAEQNTGLLSSLWR